MLYMEGDVLLNAPDGLYLCYVNHDHVKNRAERVLLMKYESQFYYRYSDVRYRDVVYGGYGPVPAMELE